MSLTRIVQSIRLKITEFRSNLYIINQFIQNDPSKLNFNFALTTTNGLHIKTDQWSLENIFDAFLWHAPRSRRPIERRLRRKFGFVNPHSKLLKRKGDLVLCDECGSWHEMTTICQICYLKVKKETDSIQQTIMEKLGLRPVEKEVKLNYENEKIDITDDKYFVEIPRERPSWFASNLISNSVNHVQRTKQIAEKNDLEVKIIDK